MVHRLRNKTWEMHEYFSRQNKKKYAYMQVKKKKGGGRIYTTFCVNTMPTIKSFSFLPALFIEEGKTFSRADFAF